MGIFQSRPEEPSEWGGLPAEPRDESDPVEMLPPPVDDLGVFGAAGVAISMPVETLLADATPSGDGAEPERDDLDSPHPAD